MGIFDFFKKKEEVEDEKISFANLNSWAKEKEESLKEAERSYKNSLKSEIANLSNNLNEGIDKLKNLDWNKIKEEQRIKQIVKENLQNYTSHLEQLKNTLENIENPSKERIETVFKEFDKKAGMSYQKSTYLIGKEMAEIKDNVRSFFKNLEKRYSENSLLMKNIELFNSIRGNIESLNRTDRLISEINSEVANTEDTLKEKNRELEMYNGEIDIIKGSKEYSDWKEKERKILENKENLESEIAGLKNMIDFKTLAGVWHKNKEMEIVKKFKDNFKNSINDTDSLLKIISVLDNKEEIKAKIEKIKLLREKDSKIEKSPLSGTEEEIKKINEESQKLNSLIDDEKKKISKMESQKTEIIESIKSLLKNMNVEVE